MNLLGDIALPSTINEKAFGKVLKFLQTMCYSGMEDESVTETIVRIYKQLKTKTSQSILPDETSILQKLIYQRMLG